MGYKKSTGIIILSALVFACSPVVNNIEQSRLPKPSASSLPSISSSTEPVRSVSPTISPSSAISSSASPVINMTPVPKDIRNPEDIVSMKIYSDDNTLVSETNFDFSNTSNFITSSKSKYYNMLKDEKKIFKAQIVYKDGFIYTDNIEWSSSLDSVAIVGISGFVRSGNRAGTTNIIAKSISYPYINTSFRINLYDSWNRITISKNSNCERVETKQEIIRYTDKIYSPDGFDYVPYNNSSTADYREIATFNGKVYDPNLVPIDGVTITSKSIEQNVNWIGENQITVGGAYVVRNAPVCADVLITASKDGYTTRTKKVTLKSSLYGDPLANVFDFNGVYAIQDEPEITQVKVNGKIIESSSLGDEFINNQPLNSKPTIDNLKLNSQIKNVGNIPLLTAVDNSRLQVELTFSEPVRNDDIKNFFRITSELLIGDKHNNYIIDSNSETARFVWSADEKTVIFYLEKHLPTKSDGEAKYMIDFSQAFRDKTDKSGTDRRYFRFSDTQINDFAVFSVKSN